MAQRRMFSPKITNADVFLDMPVSARELYFQLGMNADDDGFITPKKIIRMIGASEDDLRILIAKNFVIPFQSGVVVITSWKVNNLVRKDWYQPTIYKNELSLLTVDQNNEYAFINQEHKNLVNENVPNSLTEVRLGKVSIGKNKKDICAKYCENFEKFWAAYPIKKSKEKSLQIFLKLKVDDALLQTILDAIELQKQERELRENKGLFCPGWKNPNTWLNGKCWQDEVNLNIKQEVNNEQSSFNRSETAAGRIFGNLAKHTAELEELKRIESEG